MEDLAEQIIRAEKDEESFAESIVKSWTKGTDTRWSNAHGNIKTTQKILEGSAR